MAGLASADPRWTSRGGKPGGGGHLVHVEDDTRGSSLFKSKNVVFEWVIIGANHATSLEVFFLPRAGLT